MRHLPGRGRLFSGGGGGAGLPIGLGATSPGGGSGRTHESRAKRGPWGSKLQRGLKALGGGVWKRGWVGRLRLAECPWHPGQSKGAGGRLIEVGDGERWGRSLLLLGRWERYGGEVWGGLCNPYNLPSGLRSSWGNVPCRRCSS